jgi:hypothetical protein
MFDSDILPRICWPIDVDQPANAAYLSVTLDVAFELIETRSGLGRRPLARGSAQPSKLPSSSAAYSEMSSLLDKLHGPEGARKRRNVRAWVSRLRGEWKEGGSSWKTLNSLEMWTEKEKKARAGCLADYSGKINAAKL